MVEKDILKRGSRTERVGGKVQSDLCCGRGGVQRGGGWQTGILLNCTSGNVAGRQHERGRLWCAAKEQTIEAGTGAQAGAQARERREGKDRDGLRGSLAGGRRAEGQCVGEGWAQSIRG